MASRLYYKHQTASQSIYYTMRILADKAFRIRPDLEDMFCGEFIYPLEIIRNAIPFALLQPASTVLHVGFDRTYFDKGMSHPLIEAAIVGNDGFVRCIDPDTRNVDALNDYATSHDLIQLGAQKAAAWNRSEDLEFAYDCSQGPNSGTLAIPEQREYASRQSGNRIEIVRARPIDEIVPDLFGPRPLDFLALTVNGAEPQVLEGAKITLRNNPNLRISMALAFRHFSFEIRKRICNQMMSEGWSVILANSPHDPWHPSVFLWCCMVREPQDFMEQLGAVRIDWEQAVEVANNESALAAKRADEIRMQILRTNKPSRNSQQCGLFKRRWLSVARKCMALRER